VEDDESMRRYNTDDLKGEKAKIHQNLELSKARNQPSIGTNKSKSMMPGNKASQPIEPDEEEQPPFLQNPLSPEHNRQTPQSNPTVSISTEKSGKPKQPLLLAVRELQTTRRDQMAKNYNAAHLIHIFKIGDIATVAIPAKVRAVNDAPRMEARIIDIPRENRHTLQTECGVLTNLCPTSELNQVPAELAGPLQRKLTDISVQT
ncbi:hypothetical protein MMC31_006950, partial [Peltigera leucophlebia]|nr:hypothetical protein [Peltigera leucophlebia]